MGNFYGILNIKQDLEDIDPFLNCIVFIEKDFKLKIHLESKESMDYLIKSDFKKMLPPQASIDLVLKTDMICEGINLIYV